MNWIAKLERKYGRFCIPNLISILIGGQILVYAIELFVNQYISLYLDLDRSALLMGQIWRVITFVFVPFSGGGPLSVILGIYFTWFIGTALEKEWGDFRFNLYLLLGMLGAVAGLPVHRLGRYLLPLPFPAAGLCHAVPRGAGAAVFCDPHQGEILWPVCRGAVGVQLSDGNAAGQGELSAGDAGLCGLLWAAGRPQRPGLGAPGTVEAEE